MDKIWLIAWSHEYVHQQYERGCMLHTGYHVNCMVTIYMCKESDVNIFVKCENHTAVERIYVCVYIYNFIRISV